jgi:hypothetical protein
MALTVEQELAQLRQENTNLKAKAEARQKVSFKVSEKGAISTYGLGRWPITMYLSQVTRFLDAAPQLRMFIEENKDRLAVKPE